MTKPLRVGSIFDVNKPVADTVAHVQGLADAGLDHAFATQVFDHDALTLLAAVGVQVGEIALGTGVVPIYPRHPMMLAQQALTVQSAIGNRLLLGIGLSHQVVVESMWGLSYDKPATYMKEYLAALMPLLHGEAVDVHGERVACTAFSPINVPAVSAPPVLVAALGSVMLRLAGTVADGTMTWMTGTKTVTSHIVPTIRAAAEAAGRAAPRVVVSLPVCVTSDVDAASALVDKTFAVYTSLPSYKAMLDKEGASSPSDIALIGDDDAISAGLESLAAGGATDFVAAPIGSSAERARTTALLGEIARST